MNTPLSWIKVYVPDLDVDVQEFVDKMTLSGSHVESYERKDKNLENIHGALIDILIVLNIIIKNKIETLIIPIMPNSSDIIENIKSV